VPELIEGVRAAMAANFAYLSARKLMGAWRFSVASIVAIRSVWAMLGCSSLSASRWKRMV
jgi:hypothetical protein